MIILSLPFYTTIANKMENNVGMIISGSILFAIVIAGVWAARKNKEQKENK